MRLILNTYQNLNEIYNLVLNINFLFPQTSSKIFHAALKSIQTKVEAVVNIKFEEDDVVEVVNGPIK